MFHSRDSDAKDFVQHVLNLRLGELNTPLPELTRATALKNQYHSTQIYYQSFIPLILDEARASIAEGLAAKNQGKRKEFFLKLQNFNASRNKGNPSTFTFFGNLPQEDQHSSSMNVLLITTNKNWKDRSGITFLVIASGLSGTIKAKGIVFPGTIAHNARSFQPGQRWQSWYLNSLITEERMFKACQLGASSDSLREISTASVPRPTIRRYAPPDLSNIAGELNSSQERAIQSFLSRDTGVTLLQGPPGTGKTTTITAMLRILSQDKTTTLVSAPSNKAVQVLAERFLTKAPEIPAILVGVEDKIPFHLRPMFLHTWKADSLSLLSEVIANTNYIANFKPRDEQDLARIKTLFVKKLDQAKEKLEKSYFQLNKYQLLNHSGYLQYPTSSAFDTLLRSIEILKIQIQQFNPEVTPTAPEHSFEARFSQMTVAASATASESKQETPDSRLTKLKQHIEHPVQRLKLGTKQITTKIATLSDETIEKHLLQNSRVIFSTLSVTGRFQMRENMPPITTLVVDEASQTVEAETLIAFQHTPKRVLLVGDTKQLPATIISEPARTKHFDWSMMWRLAEKNDCHTLMLDTQYRMHPEICRWPSKRYYDGQLQTGREDFAKQPIAKAETAKLLNRPRAFYDLKSKEQSRGHSYYNDVEARYVANIVSYIRKTDKTCSIGVITFYAAQVTSIQAIIKHSKLEKKLKVNSVDGFQGGECDIIILSCVRTGPKGIGFLKDFRRLNVAITRARDNLIILGNGLALQKHPSDLKLMIQDTREHHQYFSEKQLRGAIDLAPIAQKTVKEKGKHSKAASGKKVSSTKKKTSGASAATQTSKPKSVKPSQRREKKPIKKTSHSTLAPCRFFNGKAGSCRKKETCKFSHANPGS